MSLVKMQLFFDESGKQDSSPTIMGGLSIPDKVYQRKVFQNLCTELQSGSLNLHWAKYSGLKKQRENILRVINDTMDYQDSMKFNLINYYKPYDSTYDTKLFSDMIYTKLPERILYGLLRGYGKNITLEASITIEASTEYLTKKLNETVKCQLNIQSIYRGETFKIATSDLKPKNQEIGLELTDLILGIIRTILLNEDPISSTKIAKNKLVCELLSHKKFYTFLTSIKYYEWTSSKDLNEISFADYIKIYLAEHS